VKVWQHLFLPALPITSCSGAVCSSLSGFTEVTIPVNDESLGLKVYGVAESNVEVVRKEAADGQAKVVVFDASGEISHELNGSDLTITVGGGCGAAPSPTAAAPTPTAAAPTPTAASPTPTAASPTPTAASPTPTPAPTAGTGDSASTTKGQDSTSSSASMLKLGVTLPLLATLGVDMKTSLAVGTLLAASSASATSCDQFVKLEIHTPPSVTTCDTTNEIPEPTEPAKQSIFDSPTDVEMNKIVTAFETFNLGSCDGGMGAWTTDTVPTMSKAPLPGPNTTAIKTLFGADSVSTAKASSSAIWGGIQHTYISRIDALWPVKSEALAYLDGSGPNPGRYAKVNVAFGQCATPYFKEYKVGPLDGNAADMTMTELAKQPWGSRPREGNEMAALGAFVNIMMNEDDFATLTRESFGGVQGEELNHHKMAPPGLGTDERKTMIRIDYKIKGTWRGKDMVVLPLSFTIDAINGDPSQWTASDFYYNAQGPFTHDELLAKYKDGTLTKVTMPANWADTVQDQVFPIRGSRTPRPYSDIPGPQSYMPKGNRFSVNGRTVKWMDWEFHAGYNFRAGSNFHDIKFKGDRIAYEVSMSEVFLTYSGNDPIAGNVIFFDATFGNGEYREMIRGMDCPAHAKWIDNSWYAAPGGAFLAKRATCIFESWQEGIPAWRRGGPFVSATRNEVLIVRTMMTNGNYDYSASYTFDLAGQMRVDFTSTGFLQTHYFRPEWGSSNSMAFKIHNFTGGSLHDHTFGVKVDFDVISKENTFQLAKFKWGDTLSALNEGRQAGDVLTEKPAWMLFDKMRYMSKENQAVEWSGSVDPQNPGMWLFGDINKLNAWGNPRMYKLLVNDAHALAGNPDDHVAMPAASFVKNMLSVTTYKEDEPGMSGDYDMNRLNSPQVNLESRVNGESIDQQDLVAWVSLAAMHMPHSENWPMTNNLRHGITISPFNFFDENPIMDMPNYHRMMGADNIALRGQSDPPSADTCIPPTHDTTMEWTGVY